MFLCPPRAFVTSQVAFVSAPHDAEVSPSHSMMTRPFPLPPSPIPATYAGSVLFGAVMVHRVPESVCVELSDELTKHDPPTPASVTHPQLFPPPHPEFPFHHCMLESPPELTAQPGYPETSIAVGGCVVPPPHPAIRRARELSVLVTGVDQVNTPDNPHQNQTL